MRESEQIDRDIGELIRAGRAPWDPNSVAACAAGEGAADEAARLARDAEAVLVMRWMQADRRRGRRLVLGMAAAAAVVVAGVLLLTTGPRAEPAPSLAAQLATLGSTLRAEAPELFGDFRPRVLEARAGGPAVTRGAGRWIAPVGIVAEAPRRLRFEPPSGTTRVEIGLRGNGVRWTREVSGVEVEAPTLGPGTYVVTLRALDALGGQTSKRSFTVASAAERAQLKRARERIEAHAEGGLADLLWAHYALERRWFALAEAAARRAEAQGGDTREQAQRILERLPGR